MQNDRIVVGLDIGTTKVCAIVGKLDELGKVNILGFGKAESDGVRRGVVDNIDKTVAAIRKAVEEAEQHANVEINLVHVGISGEHIRSMQHKGIITLNGANQEITQVDVDRLRQDMYRIAVVPGTEILHVIPQEYTVDRQSGIPDPVGMSGVRLEGNFHIVTGQSTSAANVYRCVRKAGLQVQDLILEPLASSYAVLTEEELEAGVCLVDIGGGTTDVAIFEDNIIRHTAVIPFGGNIITEDIKQGCSVMRRQAELLKTRFGAAMADAIVEDEIITIAGLKDKPTREIRKRTLASIIQARMEEIMELVALEINNSGYHNKLVGGIVVTGGGSQLQHIDKLINYVTGMDTRIGYPNEYLAKGMVEEVSHPAYATGTGLVIYGLRSEQQQAHEAVGDGAIPTVKAGKKIPKAEATMPEPAAAQGSNSFLNKMKSWFESSITNASNYIE